MGLYLTILLEKNPLHTCLGYIKVSHKVDTRQQIFKRKVFQTDTDTSSTASAVQIQDMRCPAVKDHRKLSNVHVKPISWENDRMTSE